MSDIRAEWITTIQKYWLSPGRPDNEQFWCTRLDTAPQEELRAIQSEKLRVAVRYAYECIPFYRRKFDRISLQPGDIHSVDDLPNFRFESPVLFKTGMKSRSFWRRDGNGACQKS